MAEPISPEEALRRYGKTIPSDEAVSRSKANGTDLNAVNNVDPRQDDEQAPVPIRAHNFIWREPELIPRRDWLYPNVYVRQFVSITIAAGAVGKTGECLVEAVALALGRDLLKVGGRFPSGIGHRVWYWNGEDPLVEMERQVHAIAQHYRLHTADRTSLTHRLFLDSGRDKATRIDLVKDGPRGTVIVNIATRQQLIDTIRENSIDLSVFDPVADFATVAQNSNEAMNAIVKTCGEIAAETNSAIGLVHHPRKTGGSEVTVEDARGGSALVAGTRVARVLNRMTAEEGARAGIKGNAHKRYFRMASEKINLTPPEDDTTWRFVDAVTLPNGDPGDPINPDGDSVRVVTKWDWPNAFAGLRHDQIIAFQDALDIEEKFVRADPQSSDWAGYLLARILDIDCAHMVRSKSELSPQHVRARTRCREILNAWVNSGMLVHGQGEPDRKHPDRRPTVLKVGARFTG